MASNVGRSKRQPQARAIVVVRAHWALAAATPYDENVAGQGSPFAAGALRSTCPVGFVIWSSDAADRQVLLGFQSQLQNRDPLRLTSRVTVGTTARRLARELLALPLQHPDAVRMLLAGVDRAADVPVAYDLSVRGRRPLAEQMPVGSGVFLPGTTEESAAALSAEHAEQLASLADDEELPERLAMFAERVMTAAQCGCGAGRGVQAFVLHEGSAPQLRRQSADGRHHVSRALIGGDIERPPSRFDDGVVDAAIAAAIPLIEATAARIGVQVVRYERASSEDFPVQLVTWLARTDPRKRPQRIRAFPLASGGRYTFRRVDELAAGLAQGWEFYATSSW